MIVPALDEERDLPLLLASLAESGPDRPDEVLLVDGGSTDRTRELALEQGARVLSAPPGRGTQLAFGAREARGEVFVFLHADTRLRPGAMGAIRSAFADPALAYAGLRQRIDHPRPIFRAIERAANARARRGMIYGDSGLCVRSEVYFQVGGFREIPLFEDVDLSRRLARQHRVGWVGDAELLVSARRWEREGVVRCTARNWTLAMLFRAGVAPERLVRYYRVASSR